MSGERPATDAARLKRLEQASEWFVRLADPSRTEADMNEWLHWCDEDPENLAAFEAYEHDWRDLDGLKGRPRRSDRAPARRVTQLRLFAVAATLALVTIAGVLLYQGLKTAAPSQEFAATATNRSATLPDGSKVILSAQTLVKVDFSGVKRDLDLSPGQAYFRVKHDRQHPFTVRAGDIEVTAIGTAFDVRREADKTVVTVEEGAVEVAAAAGHASWRAEAGYQLTYSSRARMATIARIDPKSATDWRNGELAYEHEPLGAVIDDLNRYTQRKIVIQDRSVAELPYTGTAFTESVDDWLKAIQGAYPVEATQAPNGDVILTEKQ